MKLIVTFMIILLGAVNLTWAQQSVCSSPERNTDFKSQDL